MDQPGFARGVTCRRLKQLGRLDAAQLQPEQEDAIATLQTLKQQGKIRFLGYSSMLPHLTDHIEMDVFDVFQIPYLALQLDHETAIAEAARAGAGIAIRGGVARGEPGQGHGLVDVWSPWKRANMDELLEGMSATTFMLRFTLTNPHTHINHCRNPEPGPPA